MQKGKIKLRLQNIGTKPDTLIKLMRDIFLIDRTFYYSTETKENKWRNLKKTYKKIYICQLYFGSIGETIFQYLMIRDEMQKENNRQNYYVFIPFLSDEIEECNPAFRELLQKYICIINPSNISFWKYVFFHYMNELDFSKYSDFNGRKNTYYHAVYNSPFLELDKKIIREGKYFCDSIGLTGEYVCFHSRDSIYKEKMRGKDFNEFVNRNTSFKNYKESIDYLRQQNIQAVRMGKYVSSDCKGNYIPYAERYYEDWKDLYLCSECKFYVGPMSGINMIPKLFAKPVLSVNVVNITIGMGSCILMKENMIIPKKYYNKRTKKYLSLRQIANLEGKCGTDGSKLIKRGIIMIENTAEEIEEAVREMNMRLDGTWIESEEDKSLQKKFIELLTMYSERNGKKVWDGGGEISRIGTKYLRDNLYLLD